MTLDKEKFEKLSLVRKEFEAISADDLASDKKTGLYRWWVLRLLMACFAELYAIAFRLKGSEEG